MPSTNGLSNLLQKDQSNLLQKNEVKEIRTKVVPKRLGPKAAEEQKSEQFKQQCKDVAIVVTCTIFTGGLAGLAFGVLMLYEYLEENAEDARQIDRFASTLKTSVFDRLNELPDLPDGATEPIPVKFSFSGDESCPFPERSCTLLIQQRVNDNQTTSLCYSLRITDTKNNTILTKEWEVEGNLKELYREVDPALEFTGTLRDIQECYERPLTELGKAAKPTPQVQQRLIERMTEETLKDELRSIRLISNLPSQEARRVAFERNLSSLSDFDLMTVIEKSNEHKVLELARNHLSRTTKAKINYDNGLVDANTNFLSKLENTDNSSLEIIRVLTQDVDSEKKIVQDAYNDAMKNIHEWHEQELHAHISENKSQLKKVKAAIAEVTAGSVIMKDMKDREKPELYTAPDHQVSILQRSTIVPGSSPDVTVRPYVLSVPSPSLNQRGPEKQKYLSAPKSNITVSLEEEGKEEIANSTPPLNTKNYAKAYETLATHVLDAVQQCRPQRVVLVAYGEPAARSALKASERQDIDKRIPTAYVNAIGIASASFTTLIEQLRAKGIEVVYHGDRTDEQKLFWGEVNRKLNESGKRLISPVKGDKNFPEKGWIRDTDMLVNDWNPYSLVGDSSSEDSADGALGAISTLHYVHAAAARGYLKDEKAKADARTFSAEALKPASYQSLKQVLARQKKEPVGQHSKMKHATPSISSTTQEKEWI